MKILDPKGVWYKNTSTFQMADPEANLVYPPNEMIKIAVTGWVKSQSFMQEQPDPEAKPAVEKPVEVKKPLGKP